MLVVVALSVADPPPHRAVAHRADVPRHPLAGQAGAIRRHRRVSLPHAGLRGRLHLSPASAAPSTRTTSAPLIPTSSMWSRWSMSSSGRSSGEQRGFYGPILGVVAADDHRRSGAASDRRRPDPPAALRRHPDRNDSLPSKGSGKSRHPLPGVPRRHGFRSPSGASPRAGRPGAGRLPSACACRSASPAVRASSGQVPVPLRPAISASSHRRRAPCRAPR